MPHRIRLSLASFALACLPIPAAAQPQAPRVTAAGYIQPQWDRSADGGAARDRIVFRRLVVGLDIAFDERWSGEVQVDVAPVTLGDRLLLRDAYLRYTAPGDSGLSVTIGNQKTPFSRSVLTSSSRRALVERPLTGDRVFGAPGRTIGVRVDGRSGGSTLLWSGSVSSALQAPNPREIRIDGLPAAESDWNEGVLFAGRAEWHPVGEVRLEQGSFDVREVDVTLAVGAYGWRNDGDRNLYTADGVSVSPEQADIARASGLEASAALRLPRVFVDAEIHRIIGHTLDPTFSGGLYSDGRARLVTTSLEGGVMLLPPRLEVVAGIDTLGIARAPALMWRPAVGLDWYLQRHRLKVALLHRETFNAEGARGARLHTTFLQAQLAF